MVTASVEDLRLLARRRIPRFLFDYIDGGSFYEHTLQRNSSDLADVILRQRVLRDVSTLSLNTELFGQKQKLPFILAPLGLAGINARRGETQALRAANRAGIPFCLSTLGICSIEELQQSNIGDFWFQLYMIKDRGFVKDLLSRSISAKCSALILTVDMAQPGIRYRDIRSGLTQSAGLWARLRRLIQILARPAWALDVGVRGRPLQLGNIAPALGPTKALEDFLAWVTGNFDPSLNWTDFDWVRKMWSGPLIVKGILDVEDAKTAVSRGADGIVVSNHGGRQLDGVLSVAKALPRIVDAVGDRVTVLADGGARSGLDIVRYLALGARSVLIGRAWAYGLAARGESGVTEVIEILNREMRVAMMLSGAKSLSELNSSLLEMSDR